jgi:hypothetical protein
VNEVGVRRWLRFGAMAGDVVFVLWIVRNGINEGFSAPPVQMASYVGLIVLLGLNAALLASR